MYQQNNRRQDEMGQNEKVQDKETLVKGLKEKLHWYTMCASSEEYDAKAVESILYLLDSLEPLEKAEVLEPEEAWNRFQTLVREHEKGDLPETADATEMAKVSENPEFMEMARKSKSMEEAKAAGILEKKGETEFSQELGISENMVAKQALSSSEAVSTGSRISRDLWNKPKGLVLHYKYIVAAVLLLLVVSVVGIAGNVQVGASPDTGFFHWLKRDNTGMQMVTSPENLDGKADMKEAHNHIESENIPEWAQEWYKIDVEFEMPENYEWQRYEIEELRNFHKITSYYLDKTTKKQMLLGMVMYYDEISFNSESFVDYSYVESYEMGHKQMNVYNKKEETGKEYFVICFYDGSCQYYMQGQDNLDELKGLIEKYWFYVEKI